jgi:hypothetical protein
MHRGPSGCVPGRLQGALDLGLSTDRLSVLAVDLQVSEGIAGRLHEFALRIGNCGVVET